MKGMCDMEALKKVDKKVKPKQTKPSNKKWFDKFTK